MEPKVVNTQVAFPGDAILDQLEVEMGHFYANCPAYTAFASSCWEPDFWLPIKSAVQDRLREVGTCRILEHARACMSRTSSFTIWARSCH
jgi:hypothetical protein